MPYWLIQVLPRLSVFAFVVAVGACVGSLINVLVYRLPLGISVISPPSRCPHCETRLTWRENVPVFGWLLLGGRCRFCKSKVSPEYVLVELFVALLFGLTWWLLTWVDPELVVLGAAVGAVRPEWALNSFGVGAEPVWPEVAVILVLFACLVAMTLVDARTFTIPLILAWIPAGVAAVVIPAHAGWFEWAHGPLWASQPGRWFADDGQPWQTAPGHIWTLPTPMPGQWPWILAGFGGVLGLVASSVLVRLGLVRQSFADYGEWEERARAEQEASRAEGPGEEPPAGEDDGDPSAMWIAYPHARREMVKEIAFLGSPAGLAGLGWVIGGAVGWGDGPLWLAVLAGVCWGYLVGGGVVWAVRILGSLAFGKEAMGIGDVHLMAAVGACLGWIDSVLAFFGAAFVGLAWALASAVAGGRLSRAMPYGPYLAASTVLVVLLKPLVEAGLGWLWPVEGGVDLP